MSEIGFHLRMSLADGRVIAPTTDAQRELARAVFEAGRSLPLLSVRAADSHIHLVAACSRCQAGALVRRIGKSLHHRLALPTGFTQPHFEPVRDQQHLYRAFRYVLRQDERHGLFIDPRAEASNLPDLLGLRQNGHYTAIHVARLLPRIGPEELCACLGLTWEALRKGALVPPSLVHLADAAAATLALPHLGGRAPEAVEARRAAVHLLADCIAPTRVALLLGTTPRTVHRLRHQRADPFLVEAVARQLRLRAAARGQPSGPIGRALVAQEPGAPADGAAAPRFDPGRAPWRCGEAAKPPALAVQPPSRRLGPPWLSLRTAPGMARAGCLP